MSFKLLTIISMVLFPFEVIAQQPINARTQSNRLAADELESVITDSARVDDKFLMISVRSRAAALVSFSDREKAETMFMAIWRLAKQQDDQAFDKDRALEQVLKYLFPRNPKLARRLLKEELQTAESSLQARAAGRDPSLRRLARLSSELVDEDPSTASSLLEQALSTGVTPAAIGSLARLRERDPLLSDFVVSKTLESLKAQPTLVSLSGLHVLIGYVFPTGDTVVPSGTAATSLEALQFKYFATTYDVLKRSLTESETVLLRNQNYTTADLRFRQLYQDQVATVLAVLARRYQPVLSGELDNLARKLSVQLPPNVAQMSAFTASRLSSDPPTSSDPETAIPVAIANRDFQEAGRLIDELKNDELKKSYLEITTKARARTLLASSQLLEALSVIRKVEEPVARLLLYLEALKVAHKKGEAALATTILGEARTLVPQSNRNGVHVRALLSFVSQANGVIGEDDRWKFLEGAVLAINSLPGKSDDTEQIKSASDLAWEQLNDPRSLVDAPELESAFSALGNIDLERAITEARMIAIKPVQLIARLEAIEDVIKDAARRRELKQGTGSFGPMQKR